MKQVRLDGSGKLDGFSLREIEVPRPRRGEVLVQMRAAALNYLDLKIIHGTFPGARRDLVPLSDGAGEIAEVGEGVRRFAVGDRVATTFFPRWLAGPMPVDGRAEQPGATVDGALSEYAVFSEQALIRAPAGLSHQEVATLPCAAVTAWQLFTGPRPLLPGETVLLQGTGGVSIFSLQFARLAGAEVIATTSSAEKRDKLLSLGAAAVVDYRRTPAWGAAVRELAGGRGADHIMDVGEAGTLEQSIAAAAVDAQINLVGRPTGAPPIDPALLMGALATYRRISVGSRAHFEAMNRAIALHGIRPVIDGVFPLEDLAEAFRSFSARRHFGKVVITI